MRHTKDPEAFTAALRTTERGTGRFKRTKARDCPGGAVVKNPPANAGDTVRSLVREDPMCCGATKAGHHNC